MIQRGIGVTIGAIVSLVLLLLMTDVNLQDAVIALAIGAVAAWAWPVVIVFYLGRRARQRQQERMQGEVQRQIEQQKRQG